MNKIIKQNKPSERFIRLQDSLSLVDSVGSLTTQEQSGLDSKAGDEQALQDFYVAMDGPNWDWNGSAPQGWASSGMDLDTTIDGVVTVQHNGETRVKELNLSGYPDGRNAEGEVADGAPIGRNLTGKGPFPESFPNLRRMTHLRLKGNNLRNNLMWLADFAGSELQWVSLNGSTSYDGQDEVNIGSDEYVRYNHASKTWNSYNKFTGFMPDDLSGLTNLILLEIMSTALIGSYPTFLPSSLRAFFASNSGMNTDVSTLQWGNLTSLTHLSISNRDSGNRGEGIIGSISHVSGDLYDVTFSDGSLPSRTDGAGEWWIVVGKTSAQVDSVSGSTYRIEVLGGEVPEVGDELIINEGTNGERNHYGQLPEDWDNLSEMRWFMADGNNFGGYIPQWTSWYDLRYFGLGVNGSIESEYPHWLFFENKHPWLHTINLGDLATYSGSARGLYGQFNETQGNAATHDGLAVHSVANNDMNGDVPQWTVTQTDIIQLNLQGNGFTGSHPDLSQANELRWARCQNNEFTGSLPDVHPQHDNFQHLEFQNNQFSGDIPISYGNIQSTGGSDFQTLNLSDNLLDGDIPVGIFGNGWSIQIQNNKYTPMNLAPIMSQNLSGVTYLPQKPFGQGASHSVGTVIDLSSFDYTNNSYQWELSTDDGLSYSDISGETSHTIDTTSHGAGIYRLKITHPDIAYTFVSEEFNVS